MNRMDQVIANPIQFINDYDNDNDEDDNYEDDGFYE